MMMRRNRRMNKRRNRRAGSGRVNTAASLTRSISNLALRSQERRFELTLNYGTGLVAADGSGVLAYTIGSSPTNSPNWSDVTANWRQFVVRKFNVHFLPYEQYDKSLSTVTSPIYVAEDHRSNATPTATLVTSCARVQMKSAENAWNFPIQLSGLREMTPQNVGAPSDVAWCKMYSSGWAAAGSVGYFLVTYDVILYDVN